MYMYICLLGVLLNLLQLIFVNKALLDSGSQYVHAVNSGNTGSTFSSCIVLSLGFILWKILC